jgi:hypothetical protein
MYLVADALDKQLLDTKGQRAGRIDGIILVLRRDKPPRIAYIEVSPITMLSRFSERLSAWYARRDKRLGKGRGVPFRFPWNRLERQKQNFKLDVDVDSTPINALEDWLRTTIVERIPGG